MFSTAQLESHEVHISPVNSASAQHTGNSSGQPGTTAAHSRLGQQSHTSVIKSPRRSIITSKCNWLLVNEHGDAAMIQADKWKLTHKLGVQVRGLVGCAAYGAMPASSSAALLVGPRLSSPAHQHHMQLV